MRRPVALPPDLESLSPRQRELVRVIHARGGATAREIHSDILDPPPTIFGIRTLLNRMVGKGILRTRRSGRHTEILYLPAVSDSEVKLRAFTQLARKHFRGSQRKAIEALANLAAIERQ